MEKWRAVHDSLTLGKQSVCMKSCSQITVTDLASLDLHPPPSLILLLIAAADPELVSAVEQLDSESNQVLLLPSLPLLLLRASF